MKSLIYRYSGFLITAPVYLFTIFIIAPWGNFSINDDFYYLAQVKAFSLGIFTKSALVSPTFILQAFMGFIWSKIFGLTYVSLRILTILVTLICILVLDRIYSFLNIKQNIKAVSLLLIVFIPYLYVSSLTFMTENYFLLFVLLSLHYFLRYCRSHKMKQLFFASVMGGLSIMIRQYGIVLIITYLLVYIISKRCDFEKRELATILLPFLTFGILGIYWPKYYSPFYLKSVDMRLFFTDIENLLSRLTDISPFPYIFYILIPFAFAIFSKLQTKIKFILMLLAIPISRVFYSINIFSIGNLFYLESLYIKLSLNVRENLLNNLIFKTFLSYFIALSLLVFLYSMFLHIYRRVNKYTDAHSLTLVVMTIGFYLIVMLTDRVYDRYFLNFLVVLVILITYLYNKHNIVIGTQFLTSCIFICSVTFLLTFDYYRVNQLKWSMANRLHVDHAIDEYDIFIDENYASTIFMEKYKNYKGLIRIIHSNYHPKCFIQEYIKQNGSGINNLIDRYEQSGFINKYLPTPKSPYTGLMKDKSNHFDPKDILYFDKEYSSPIYNILGKRTFVRAFCIN